MNRWAIFGMRSSSSSEPSRTANPTGSLEPTVGRGECWKWPLAYTRLRRRNAATPMHAMPSKVAVPGSGMGDAVKFRNTSLPDCAHEKAPPESVAPKESVETLMVSKMDAEDSVGRFASSYTSQHWPSSPPSLRR